MEAALHPWPALGALLLRDGLVTREELEAVLAEQRDSPHQRISGKRLGEALVERGIVTAPQVAQLVAEQYTIPFMELTESEVGIRAAVLVPEDLARRLSALPISTLPDGSLLVAVADPPLALFSDELHSALGVPLRFAVATSEALEAAITYAFERARLLGATAEHDLQAPAPTTTTEPEETVIGEEPATARSELVVLTRPWPALGALLVRDGVVSEEVLDAALAEQRISGNKRLGEILVRRGAVTPTEVARLVAEQYELPFVDLVASEIEREVATSLPESLARRYAAVPVGVRGGEILVALADPTKAFDAHELRSSLDAPVRFVAAAPEAIDAAITFAYEVPVPAVSDDDIVAVEIEDSPETYGADEHRNTEPDAADVDEESAPVLRWGAAPDVDEPPFEASLVVTPERDPEPTAEAEPEGEVDLDSGSDVDRLLGDAIALRASHVHFTQVPDGIRVRARVDGVLRELARLTSAEGDTAFARMKELAGIEPVARATPCEGRICFPTADGDLDLRLSILPTVRGEKLIVNVHAHDVPTTLAELGLRPDDEEAIREILREPAGSVVFCGPAGSGRTTTLYAALHELSTTGQDVTSIEQTIDRELPDIDQIEVSPGRGLTAARSLRAVLRSDTDVVAVEDVRDGEVAATVLEAAVSRLVLCTLEASDAAEAIWRLEGATRGHGALRGVTCIVSQRLVREICGDCRETYYADEDELAALRRPADETGMRLLARGRGCETCGGSGFNGRTGLFEVLLVSRELRDLAERAAPADEVERALAHEMRPLADEGVRLCLEGVTTVAEVRRVLGSHKR